MQIKAINIFFLYILTLDFLINVKLNLMAQIGKLHITFHLTIYRCLPFDHRKFDLRKRKRLKIIEIYFQNHFFAVLKYANKLNCQFSEK